MYQLYRDFNLVKKGQKIRAWVNPPLFGQCPKENVFFLMISSLRAPIGANNVLRVKDYNVSVCTSGPLRTTLKTKQKVIHTEQRQNTIIILWKIRYWWCDLLQVLQKKRIATTLYINQEDIEKVSKYSHYQLINEVLTTTQKKYKNTIIISF